MVSYRVLCPDDVLPVRLAPPVRRVGATHIASNVFTSLEYN